MVSLEIRAFTGSEADYAQDAGVEETVLDLPTPLNTVRPYSGTEPMLQFLLERDSESQPLGPFLVWVQGVKDQSGVSLACGHSGRALEMDREAVREIYAIACPEEEPGEDFESELVCECQGRFVE